MTYYPGMQRWIMHIDMDAFYASIEQLDHPEWRGKPVIVGGTSDRGVVSAASYEARKYGVRSAIPIFQARRLCPHGIFTRGRMGRYAEISRQVMAVLGRFSPVVEKASIDEAYLDAGGLERLFGPIDQLGRAIKKAVKEETGLTCSIGAAPVKFLAKIASDLNKPDGLSIIYPEELQTFLERLPLEKIPGLGKQTLKKIAAHGMRTAGDAQRYTQEFWVQRFGKAGQAIYERCRGIDGREVEPYTPPKSESAENTFERDISDREELKTWLLRQAERVGASLRREGLRGRTVTLKVKYADFTQLTRSHSLPEAVNSTRIIYELGCRLLDELELRGPLRLIGLGVSNFIGLPASAPSSDKSARVRANGAAGCAGHAYPGDWDGMLELTDLTGPDSMAGMEDPGDFGVPGSKGKQGDQGGRLSVPGSSERENAAGSASLPSLAGPARLGRSSSSAGSAGEGAVEQRQALLPGIAVKKEQDALLPPELDSKKEKALDEALDKVRNRFGSGMIVRGRLFEKKD